VIAANPTTFFQSYWVGGRDDMLSRAERAKRAGAAGFVLTLDWSFDHGRDWGSPTIPSRMNLKTIASFAPQVLLGAKFRYLWRYAKTLGPPDLAVPNMTLPGQAPPAFFDAYGQWMQTPQPTWEDIRWFCEQWDGQFMIKGVTRVDDAKRVVDIGASALSVSNHVGNNLDGTPATIRALPAVADAVGDQLEIVMDGGIRRGSDVVKALALGARAVMIGRAYLWGLAANGRQGVQNVLDILSNGLDSGLMALRTNRPADLNRHDLVVPANFERQLGADDLSADGE
jgi:L-lactate dehydrogenase (cytochrome)